MSSTSVIGKLRVNLGLDSREFDRGIRGVGPNVARMRNQFLAVAGAAAALGAGLAAVARQGAADIDRAAKSARRLGASIGGFRALELAAGEAGVSLSGLTNDIQTMDREIASIGTTGNGKRALDALGLTLDDLADKDADEKLATIADAVKDMGLSTGQATAVLRDLGVRNREMVLLVSQGGAAIRAARADVEQYGLSLSAVDAARIESANDAIGRLSYIGKYAAQQLAIELVPAMGRLAKVMTDSLREGGMLRGVIDGLVGNLDRMAVYIGTIVTGFGVRYVAALAAARLATLSFAGSLAFLRGALIRTGIGIAVVAAGEMVFQFTRLVSAAGGFGAAMGALKEVALDVWDRIKRGAALVGESFEGAALAIKAAFLGAFASILEGFAGFTGTIASGWNTLLGSMGIEVNAQGLGAGLAASLRSQADSAFDSANVYNASLSASWSDLTAPLESVGKLRDLVKGTKDETEGAADAADRLNTALDELDGKGGGGAGKVKDASDKLKDSFDSVRAAAKSAFSGVVTGAKTAKEALRDVLNSFLQLAANRLFESMLGPIFDKIKIPGFAMGTNFAPGGLAVVGEAGPELVNLPRGSQVVPNHRMAEALTGGNSRVELMIHAPDSVTVRQVGEISRAVSVEVSTRMAREQAAGLQGGIDSLSARGVS